MATVVVSAEPAVGSSRAVSWRRCPPTLKSFEDLRRRAPVQPLLVFLTTADYHRLRSLLRTLKPGSPERARNPLFLPANVAFLKT
jgi:hypothetical protein